MGDLANIVNILNNWSKHSIKKSKIFIMVYRKCLICYCFKWIMERLTTDFHKTVAIYGPLAFITGLCKDNVKNKRPCLLES